MTEFERAYLAELSELRRAVELLRAHNLELELGLDDAGQEADRLRAENGRLLTELLDADRYVGAAETDMEMLRARVARLESVLRSVEWGADIRVGDGDYDNGCLVCFRLQRDGHAPNCALDAALREDE